MPEHREKKHIFTHNNGAVVEVHTDWTHSTLHPLTFRTVEIKLHDYSGGNEITLWHNGERWIVRYDERALGDHNNSADVVRGSKTINYAAGKKPRSSSWTASMTSQS